MECIKALRTLAVVVTLSIVGVMVTAAPALAAPEIALTPASGALGTEVSVSGQNFESYRGDNISIYFDGREVDTLVVPDSGSFSSTFAVPDDAVAGRVYVSVRDELENQLGTWRPFIVDDMEVDLRPADGMVGTDVTILGKGFYASEEVTVYYSGERVDNGVETAGTTGELSYSFTVPESTAGDHQVRVEDTLGNSEGADFQVIPFIELDRSLGATRDEITVGGTGFGDRVDVIVEFDGTDVAVEQTDRKGSFEVAFNVPVKPPGNYDINVEDDDGNEDEMSFTITAGIDLSQYEGNVGTTLTVSGIGFMVNHDVVVRYDDLQVATATTDGNGAFSVTVVVSASVAGNHTVAASDDINIVTRIFTMESSPPETPELLLPGDGEESEAEAFLSWEAVHDSSGVYYNLQIATDADFASLVLEKDDLPTSDYILEVAEELSPTDKDAPYYWRVKAVDGASNESGWSESASFYVSSGRFSLSAPARNALIAVGITAGVFFGFWLGRRTSYSKV